MSTLSLSKYPGIVRAVAKVAPDLTPDEYEYVFRRLLTACTPEELTSIAEDDGLWQLPYQQMPTGSWRRWLMRFGRGAGKSYTGARKTNTIAKHGRKLIRRGTIGIIGRTFNDARYTMVEGPSGILATAPLDFKPIWEPGNGVIRWPNGIIGRIFSADRPEMMRGSNWSFVWADEPAHWPDVDSIWWEIIEPALRLGIARAILTTTPSTGTFLRDLESRAGTVVSRASTYNNIYLSPTVRDAYRTIYDGTRIGRRELDGEDILDSERSLWTRAQVDADRVSHHPELKRIVVAIDPAVTSNSRSNETGITAAGLGVDDHVYILHSRGVKGEPGKPDAWARAGLHMFCMVDADSIIGEVNNGGDLVEMNIKVTAKDMDLPAVTYKSVSASRGKVTRAEPVAAMYEQHRVHHVGDHDELENELFTWDPIEDNFSPNILDSMVWAVHELAIGDSIGPLGAYAMAANMALPKPMDDDQLPSGDIISLADFRSVFSR